MFNFMPKISNEFYNVVLNSIAKTNIQTHKSFIEGQILEGGTKYDILVSAMEIEYTESIFQISRLNNMVSNNGVVCIIVSGAVLFSAKYQKYRDEILKVFKLRGVISIERSTFKYGNVQLALLMLDRVSNVSFFSTVKTTTELEEVIVDGLNSKDSEKITYTHEISSDFFTPDYYDKQLQDVNKKLANFKTEKLEDVAEIIIGASISPSEFREDGIRYIRSRDIQNGEVIDTSQYISPDLASKFAKCSLIEGDILVTKQFGQRKIAYVTEEDCPAIAASGLFILRSFGVPSRYLFDYLKSEFGKEIFNRQLRQIETGTTIKNINLKDIKKVIIPVLDKDTMIKISYLNTLNVEELSELSKNINKVIYGIERENKLKSRITMAGWDPKEIIETNGKDIGADVLLCRNGKIVAAIEVKSNKANKEETLNRLRQRFSKSFTTYPLYIVTDLQNYFVLDSYNNSIEIIDKMLTPNEVMCKIFREEA